MASWTILYLMPNGFLPASLDGANDLASWQRRAAAHMLDGAVAGTLSSLVGFGAGQLSLVLGVVVGVCGYGLYFVLGHGSRSGQTPVKRLLGIAVRSSSTGGRAGYGRALVRFCALVALGLTVLPVLVDFLWPLRDRRRQAWHDKAAGTIVVRD